MCLITRDYGISVNRCFSKLEKAEETTKGIMSQVQSKSS